MQKQTYDCLVPLSGGKDSTYALYLCDKIYDMKCLAVTFDNGFLSEHAKTNIKNAVATTRADHIFYSISRKTMLELFNLFIKKCSIFCQPCMRGIDVAIHIADNFSIPTIIAGTGGRVSYLSKMPEVFQDGDVDYFRNVVKGEPIEKDIREMLFKRSSWNLKKVIRITTSLFRIPNPNPPQYISLYDYIDVSYDDIKSTIHREMGWNAPDEKFEHMDCLVHDIASYIHTIKFPEVTHTTFHNSGLIRLGLVSRAEALEIEKKNLLDKKVPKELASFLREINLNENEFMAAVQNWKEIYKYRNNKKNIVKSMYHKVIRFS